MRQGPCSPRDVKESVGEWSLGNVTDKGAGLTNRDG